MKLVGIYIGCGVCWYIIFLCNWFVYWVVSIGESSVCCGECYLFVNGFFVGVVGIYLFVFWFYGNVGKCVFCLLFCIIGVVSLG